MDCDNWSINYNYSSLFLFENTNFGIKSSTLKSFLKVHDIDVPNSSFFSGLFNIFSSTESIVRDKVDNATVFIECKNK